MISNSIAGTKGQYVERKNDPPGRFTSVAGIFIVLIVCAVLLTVIQLGSTQEGKFHAQVASIDIPGSTVLFDKQDNGDIVATVSLSTKWERTPLFKDMGVEGRAVVAKFTYPGVAHTPEGASELAGQINSDVESLMGGDRPQSFTGIYHTSHFTIVGATTGGAIPLNVYLVGFAMMIFLLVGGRRENLLYLCGCLMGLTLIGLGWVSWMTYTGKGVFFPIQTTEITRFVHE